MDINDPKFLIIYMGGSGGDFLNSVINYLYCKDNKPIIILDSGKCESPYIIKYFKNNTDSALVRYSDDKILYKDLCSLSIHTILPILEISNLFLDIKLYYIDYTGYEEELFLRFHSLIFNNEEDFIKELKDNKFVSEKLKLKITNKNWKITGMYAWKNVLTQYKSCNADSIPLQIFFDYDLFCQILKEKFLLEPDNYVKVMFDTWQEKNKRFFKKLQVV